MIVLKMASGKLKGKDNSGTHNIVMEFLHISRLTLRASMSL